ncbi:PEGA domain-containing protein [Thalassotalea ganghwensis]
MSRFEHFSEHNLNANPKNHFIQASDFTPSQGKKNPKIGHFSRPVNYILVLVFVMALAALWYLFTARSVLVQTVPASEQIEISGGWAFKWNEYYLMQQGQYQVNAQLKGYYPIAQSFTVEQAQNQSKSFAFTPLPGKLELNVSPTTSYQLLVDNKLVQVKENLSDEISAGEHQVTIRAPRYFEQTKTVTIEGKSTTQSLAFTLVPAWADISISSDPEAVEVYQNETLLGVTPLTTELLQGEHRLVFQKQGYQTTYRDVRVVAGEHQSLKTVGLIKVFGNLVVESQPSGASVTFGDSFLGKTPLEAEVMPDENQPLMLFKEGYKALTVMLSVPSGQQTLQRFTLQPLIGDIEVNVVPEDALIYIDERLMGRANQTFSLPIKKQSIKIEKEGYVSYQADILPSATQVQALSITLKTEQQARFDNLKPEISAATGSKLKLFKPNDTFVMGASRREQGRRANEAQRTVKLTKPFYFGVTEITNQEFKQFDKAHFSGHVKGNSLNGARQPVVEVTWLQAALFCNWLSARDNLTAYYVVEDNKVVGQNEQANGYRLPTEAEWSYVARYENGQMAKYPWGEQLPPPQGAANLADVASAPILGRILTNYNDQYVVSAPVAKFVPNSNGIFDLSGNVAEWVNDYYHIPTGLSLKTEENPLGPDTGDYRVIRGASWAHGTRTELRLSYRDYSNDKRNDLGFRIARNAL